MDHTDDIEFEEEGELSADKIQKLRADLKAALKEKEEYLTGWQRAKADVVNARKDAERTLLERTQFANAGLIESLLPVIDSFDTAMKGSGWSGVDASWRSGVEMIYQQLLSALKDAGAEPFDDTGKPFNPERHEPMKMEPAQKGAPPDTVQNTLQRGWLLNGRVIRPAKVTVTE